MIRPQWAISITVIQTSEPTRGARPVRLTRIATDLATNIVARLPPVVRILVFASFLAGIGVWLLALTPESMVVPDRVWSLPFVVLAVAFAASEATALHVEIRKESHSLSLSGIPLMFGLLYLSPLLLALAYVVGAAPVMLWIRKSDPLKALWNSCLFFAEAALAGLIVRQALGGELPQHFVEWLIPLGAVLAAELVSLVAVPLVIMASDGKFRANLFADVGQSQILAALGGSFTVTAISASTQDPLLLLFAFVPVLGIGALLRSAGHISQRFKDLQQLHSFTQALTNERGPRTLDTGLALLVEIMRSRTAGIVVFAHDDDDRSQSRVLVDDHYEDLPTTRTMRSMLDVIESGGVTYLDVEDRRPGVRDLLDHLGAAKLIGARVLGEADREAVLFVTDRLGMRHDFSADELRLFGSLARTLSARISNDLLVEQLEVQAQHDALTGLPNRLNYEIALTSSLAGERSGVVVMIDLDRFKEINDSLGHETGDRLLIEVAQRLRDAIRPTEMVARFGGDEFAMLLLQRDSADSEELVRRIADVHRRLTANFELDGISFEIGASVGVASWPTQGSTSGSLLHRADTAMYEAKRNQLGIVWYSPELDADAPRRLDLYLSSRSALENGEMFVHLQPKVAVSDGRLTGAEALVRWTHPAYGPISPLEFVPLIEQAGLIGRLTRYVIEHAVEHAATLEAAGIDIPISVNLTPRDLLDPTLPGDILDILDAADVRPASLEIEITENAMVVDFDTSIMVLTQIRNLGVGVAIDDFGTGYSSLQHLHRLPVDQLKIDRSFIKRLASDDSADAVVRASINLARDLGLTTVAEGVEDERAQVLVAGLGCDQIQGYLVSRPLAALDLVEWVHRWEHGHRRAFVDVNTRARKGEHRAARPFAVLDTPPASVVSA